jgi:hypothetical protein
MTNSLPILNGDHAQYELDNRDTPPEERSDWPYPSFDARDWAKAFCKRNPGSDEEHMVAWFANALMRGYDQPRAERQLSPQPTDALVKAVEGLSYLTVAYGNGVPEGQYLPRDEVLTLLRQHAQPSPPSGERSALLPSPKDFDTMWQAAHAVIEEAFERIAWGEPLDPEIITARALKAAITAVAADPQTHGGAV